jgi:hypothetical protein
VPGVEPCDAVGGNDPQPRRSGQADRRPVLRGPEEAQEAGALGAPGDQGARVSGQPARARAVAPAFEGMPQPQGHHFARPQGGGGRCGEA